jgi:hypothetical protein
MSYDMIDRFLRNNLGDDDYAEYSAALDDLVAPPKQDVPETNFGNMAEPKIGCVNHDCDQCRGVQEPVAQPLDARENKYFADGQEYVFESASYYARSRQLARAEQAIVKARIRLGGDCKQSLDKRTMPDWDVVNQPAAEALSYITQYLKIETYGKSTTRDDLKAMAEVNFQPPAAQPAPVQETPFQVGQRMRLEGKLFSDLWGAVANDADLAEAERGFFDHTPQPVPVKTYHDGKPWPVAPKPWVGLDEDEVEDCARGCANHAELARAIEAKLKEKNT